MTSESYSPEHTPQGYVCFCDEERDRQAGIHRASGIANAFGGYNCVCGESWLDTLGGCPVASRRDTQQNPTRAILAAPMRVQVAARATTRTPGGIAVP